jgi:hypothetical protein
MIFALSDLKGEVLSTRSELEGDRLSVAVIGCLDMETTPELRHFLQTLQGNTAGGTVRELIFDTEQLHLMSSSAISCFATFLKMVRTFAKPPHVTFRTNAAHTWQRRSFEPLRRLAEELVTIE